MRKRTARLRMRKTMSRMKRMKVRIRRTKSRMRRITWKLGIKTPQRIKKLRTQFVMMKLQVLWSS